VADRTHRLQKPIPTDPAERKARIRWLIDHKVWTHPVTVKVPPDGMGLDAPTDTWEERVVDYGSLQECRCVETVYVNPASETIEYDESLNTAFRVWLEAGPWYDRSEDSDPEPEEGWNTWNRWGSLHDLRLDCGAPTMEEALLKLASLVEVFYDEDGADKGVGHGCLFDSEDDVACEPDAEGFCVTCGFTVEPPEED
jgi:hypothetical protein